MTLIREHAFTKSGVRSGGIEVGVVPKKIAAGVHQVGVLREAGGQLLLLLGQSPLPVRETRKLFSRKIGEDGTTSPCPGLFPEVVCGKW